VLDAARRRKLESDDNFCIFHRDSDPIRRGIVHKQLRQRVMFGSGGLYRCRVPEEGYLASSAVTIRKAPSRAALAP
jgi:hypothetical protein